MSLPDFIMKKVKDCLSITNIRSQMQTCGVSSKKRGAILSNLSLLMP